MGLKSRYQVKMKQRVRRKKRRDKITAKGMNIADFYYDQFYLKTGETK